jgi:hypothetical protein
MQFLWVCRLGVLGWLWCRQQVVQGCQNAGQGKLWCFQQSRPSIGLCLDCGARSAGEEEGFIVCKTAPPPCLARLCIWADLLMVTTHSLWECCRWTSPPPCASLTSSVAAPWWLLGAHTQPRFCWSIRLLGVLWRSFGDAMPWCPCGSATQR